MEKVTKVLTRAMDMHLTSQLKICSEWVHIQERFPALCGRKTFRSLLKSKPFMPKLTGLNPYGLR